MVMVCLYGLMFYVPVNSYCHVETVCSPNQTFSWACLNKLLTSTSSTYFHLNRQQRFLNQQKENELFHDKSARQYGTWLGSNLERLELQSDSLLTLLRPPVGRIMGYIGC